MTTYEALPRFTAAPNPLTPEQPRVPSRRHPRLRARSRAGSGFRGGLRIKGVRCAPGVYELTWAPDGRATWSYGQEVVRGDRHIVWRRIGTHSILDRPLAEGHLAGRGRRLVG
ncbi:hypothetical protein [Streptomyces niveus]|uniref:hypothetical protein n=1 Tax=Streptomyces niveus TaxID=193462 RepID=UPI003417FBD6